MNAQEYNLNIRVGYGFPQTVKISQDDVGRPLSFHLLDGAEVLTIPTGATVTIHGTKPSGLGFTETCTVTGSTASINTTLEMSQEFGNCPAELVVAVGDDLIGTANFTLFVERSPHPENTIDGTFDVADSIFARMDDLEEELDEVKEDIAQLGGLSDDVKTALLQIAQKVAYIDDDGQTYYDDLYNALYPEEPPASLVSISAVYTQSGTVYDTDTLDSLKADLVVTALYDDQTTATVMAYTLSGTLEVGTSTITVSYNGKTTTFTVTVTEYIEPLPSDYVEVEYIESNPTQSAGVVYKTNTLTGDGTAEVKIGVDILSTSSSNAYFFDVSSLSSGDTVGLGLFSGTAATSFHFLASGDKTLVISPNAGQSIIGTKYDLTATITSNSGTLTDGTNTDTDTMTPRTRTGKYFSLFGIRKYNTSQNSNVCKSRIYYCTVTEDGVKKFDVKPCRRVSDDAVGFYDFVSQSFLTASGLTAGSDVA